MLVFLGDLWEVVKKWIFFRVSLGYKFINTGVTCLAIPFGGWLFGISIPYQEGLAALTWDSSGGAPAGLGGIIGGLGIVLIVVGVIIEIKRWQSDREALSRKKVIVVEVRGLRDTNGTPLIDNVPKTVTGRREQILIDLRQGVSDGTIVNPEAAINKLKSILLKIGPSESGLDRQDITLVYGGLAPVPLTFLTGVLFDDEGLVKVMDWDRHEQKWRSLDGRDDGHRFDIQGFGDELQQASEVALVVSTAYSIALDDVRQKVGSDMPIVQMALQNGSSGCHWSEEKQQALGRQFFDIAIELNNRGTKKIHLFLAAQNSVVFRFGRLYDQRNLPNITVYHYQAGNEQSYSWGIEMPVRGEQAAITNDQ